MKTTILQAGLMLLMSMSGSIAYESDGHLYDLRCTKDGYELTSKYPVSRPVGSGASTRRVTAKEKLYLGKTCDAYHKLFGEGDWCWANGGFRANFEEHSFGFARQELFCDPEPSYSMNCNCP